MSFASSKRPEGKSKPVPPPSSSSSRSKGNPLPQNGAKQSWETRKDSKNAINGKNPAKLAPSVSSNALKSGGLPGTSQPKGAPQSKAPQMAPPSEGAQGMHKGGPGGRMGSGYGCFGSMNNMKGRPASFYGAPMSMGMGSMYGGRMGSMYGAPMGMGMGSMYGGRMGSMYGAPMGMGMGSMYGRPMGMGSMYGPMGMGSMYGRPMGSMYGGGAGMGSMYGGAAGMGSMYGGGAGMGSMYGGGAGMGSMYGGGLVMSAPLYNSVISGAARRNSFFAHNDLARAPVSSEAPADVKSSSSAPPDVKSSSATPADVKSISATPAAAAPVTTQPAVIRPPPPKSEVKAPASAPAGLPAKEKVKPPMNNNIHGVVVVTNSADSPSSAAVNVKDATTLTVSSADFVFDEVLTHNDNTKTLDSVMLDDLRRHWVAGHNSTLFITGSKGEGTAALKIATNFLLDAISKVEEEGHKFDIGVNVVAFKDAEEAVDLLKTGATYAKLQLASSPVFGPAIGGVTTKVVSKGSECVSVLESGLKNQSSKNELVVALLVLKQVKKVSSTENAVYLSSLGVVIADEEPSHLVGLKEKSKSEPCILLRYAVGGASASVCLAIVSANANDDAKKVLDAVTAMQEVKNTIPRSGNVKHFVEFTRKEVEKQKAAAENQENPEKQQSMKRAISRMELMLKDAEVLLSKPMETQPKIY